MNFGNHVFLKKYLGDFVDDHPIFAIFSWNLEYVDYVDDLLRELNGTPNLIDKIKDLRNPESWEGIFSELEFARKLKSLNPEFIRTEQGVSKTPDLKVNLLGKEVFFEVKMFAETDRSPLVSDEIGKIESDLVVHLYLGKIFDEADAERLIEFLRNKIKTNEVGYFSFEGSNIEINRKRSNAIKRTWVIPSTIIPFELVRYKLFSDFKDKLSQLATRKPVFWVLDCKKWNYSHGSFESAVCGEKGLFHFKGAKCVNGIIAKVHGNTDLFLNPSVEEQLDEHSIKQLRELLEHR